MDSPLNPGCWGSLGTTLETTDEELHELQSTEAICQCNATFKSSNDADVTQMDKLSQQQVSNSFRIGHILLHLAPFD